MKKKLRIGNNTNYRYPYPRMSQNNLASVINFDQCKEIVNKFNKETNNNNFQLKSFQIAAATEVKGFLGEYFHLTIQCIKPDIELKHEHDDDDADKNAAILLKFFIKSLPSVDEQHEKVKIFKKESSLYASLLPKLQKYSTEAWCPNVYLCTKDILVLQDMNAEAYFSLAAKDAVTDKEMCPLLHALAVMHASSLLYEFQTNANIGDTYSESLKEITVHPDIPWFATGLKAILEIASKHPKYQSDPFSKAGATCMLRLFIKDFIPMVNTSAKYRNVFCHRDPWAGNIFLSHGPNGCLKPAVFVDFQTCRYCPAAIDVIFALVLNLTKDERLEKQWNYIKYYYLHLVQHVKKYISNDILLKDVIFSEEELRESIKKFMPIGFLYRALALTILKVPKEFPTDYYKNVERTEVLLQYMEENEEFCQLMEDSIEELIESCYADAALYPILKTVE